MIIGYQLVGKNGDMFANKPDNFVMSEQTIIEQQAIARKSNINYSVVAVLEGDIESPTFECALLDTRDRYSVLGVCTNHLKPEDMVLLDALSKPKDFNMISKRDTGWLVKLHDDESSSENYEEFSDEFNFIVKSAHKANYRMVEFDCDASEHDVFVKFVY